MVESAAKKLLTGYRAGSLTCGEVVQLITDAEEENFIDLGMRPDPKLGVTIPREPRRDDSMGAARDGRVYEWWNREYIGALATYIRKKRLEPVLEVGAGDGMLTKLLLDSGIDVRAVDSGAWQIAATEVERFNATEAIKIYRPKTVLVSWIPINGPGSQGDESDLGKQIADARPENVLVIGEGGNDGLDATGFVPEDSYRRVDIDIDACNLCRTDYPASAYSPEKIARHCQTMHLKQA